MSKLSKEDSALIQGILAGGLAEDRALKAIYQKFRPMVLKHVLNNKGSRDEAEDHYHDSLIALILAIQKGSFKGDSSVKNYLLSICKLGWLTKLSKRKRHQQFLETPQELHADSTSLLDREKEAAMSKLFVSLTDTCKEFVRLRYYMKHSIEEIGQIMGFANYQTAKNKHFRCIDSLRDWLAAHPKFREYLREIRE